MTAERYDLVAKVLRIGLAALIVVLILQSAVGFIKPLAFDSFNSGPFGRPDRVVLLDLEQNNGLPDLVSVAAIVAAAVGAIILARLDKPFRTQAAGLSALLLIIALVDVMQDEPGSTSESGLFVAATALTAAVLIFAALRRAPFHVGLCLLLGLVFLGLAIKGAYAYDQLLNVLGRGDEHRGRDRPDQHQDCRRGCRWRCTDPALRIRSLGSLASHGEHCRRSSRRSNP